jgi:predicted nucleotidyltransferase
MAYGCSNDNSDIDLYGFSIPPKDIIFPHLNGHIIGFGKQPFKFEQYQQHHIIDKTYNKEYDINVYNIVKYFQLVMENNPNMVDSLFVPRRCILHSTQLSEHVRENRKLFLTKKSWHTFKGYAYSQLNKCKNKNIVKYIQLCDNLNIPYTITMEEFLELETSFKLDTKLFKELYHKVHQDGKLTKRIDTIVKYGYDVKFAYHIVRLLNEVEQILIEHDFRFRKKQGTIEIY